jgi:transcriptional regulator with XRE-family HTH domain
MSAQPALDMTAIGRRVRSLRRQRQLSLEALAERSGVSVSMLSTVERGQKVPSILVMGQIATALDTSIGRLVGEEAAPRAIVMRAADQRVMKDPAGIEDADTPSLSIGCSSNVLLIVRLSKAQ